MRAPAMSVLRTTAYVGGGEIECTARPRMRSPSHAPLPDAEADVYGRAAVLRELQARGPMSTREVARLVRAAYRGSVLGVDDAMQTLASLHKDGLVRRTIVRGKHGEVWFMWAAS